MKPSAVLTVLRALLPANEPVLLTGSPGLGKTDVIRAAAQALDYEVWLSHPVVSDPTDFKGMPTITTDGTRRTAEFLPFGDLWRLINTETPLVAFFDDIGQAPPMVQAAVMQLVLARRIDNHQVSPHVRFVGATNRREDKAGVTGLISPLLDKFTAVIAVTFDLEDWLQWALRHEMPDRLLAFARFRPELFGTHTPSAVLEKSPTPRSIAGLGRLVNLGLKDLAILTGAVGPAFAAEYVAFDATYEHLPDIDAILTSPKKVPVPAKTAVAVRYATLGALVSRASPATFAALVTYISRWEKEYQVLFFKDALRRVPALIDHAAFATWAATNRAIFTGTP